MDYRSDKAGSRETLPRPEGKQLVQQVLTENEEALRTFMQRHHEALRHYFYGLVRNHHDVEDLMQETWYDTAASLSASAKQDEFKKRLFRVARFRSVDFVRREKGRKGNKKRCKAISQAGSDTVGGKPFVLEYIPDRASYGFEEIVRRENIRMIQNAVAVLPEPEKSVMELFLQGLTRFQIANALNKMEGTVAALSHRARRQLLILIFLGNAP